MKCPRCGSNLPYGTVSCRNCGAKFKTAKCPHCGKDVIPGSPFCPACRKDIKWGISNVQGVSAVSPKKPLTKRWWFWAACVLLVFGIVGNIGNAIKGSNEVRKAASPSSSDTPSVVSSEASPSSTAVSLDELTKQINSILQQNYSGSDIVFDEKTVQVTVWIDGLAAAVYSAQQEGRGADDKDWMGAKEGTLSVATSIKEVLDSFGYSDMDVALNFANDQNYENTLLSIFNGSIVYDVLQGPSSTPVPQKSIASKSGSNNFNTYDNTEQQQTEADYVLNTSSKKIHYKTCDSVKKIAPDNYKEFYGTIDEALFEGYSKCGVCFNQ